MGTIDIEEIAALRAAAVAEGHDLPIQVPKDCPAGKEYLLAVFSMGSRLIAAARGDAEGAAGADDLDRLDGLRALALAEGDEMPWRIQKGRPAAQAYIEGMLGAVPALVEAARERMAPVGPSGGLR